jgi:hypothetical protein
MILQLNPSIPVITPRGKAIAHAIIDNGIESDLQWVCFQDDTGECWTWRNPNIRGQSNETAGRKQISTFYDYDEEELDKEQEIAYLQDVCREQREIIETHEKENGTLLSMNKQIMDLSKQLINDGKLTDEAKKKLYEIALKMKNDPGL